MKKFRVTVLFAMLLIAVVAAGCGGGQQVSTPAGPPTGEALLQQRCADVCHTVDRVDRATYDQAGWEEAVSRMAGRGAQLTSEEQATLVDYLVNR